LLSAGRMAGGADPGLPSLDITPGPPDLASLPAATPVGHGPGAAPTANATSTLAAVAATVMLRGAPLVRLCSPFRSSVRWPSWTSLLRAHLGARFGTTSAWWRFRARQLWHLGRWQEFAAHRPGGTVAPPIPNPWCRLLCLGVYPTRLLALG
jgi:hypothetical protein